MRAEGQALLRDPAHGAAHPTRAPEGSRLRRFTLPDFPVSRGTVPFPPLPHPTSLDRRDRRAVDPWSLTKVRVANPA